MVWTTKRESKLTVRQSDTSIFTSRHWISHPGFYQSFLGPFYQNENQTWNSIFFYLSCCSSLMIFTTQFYHSSQVHTKETATSNKYQERQTDRLVSNENRTWCRVGDWWPSPPVKSSVISNYLKRNCAVKFASLALMGAARLATFKKGKPSWCLDVQSAKTTTSPTMIT